MVRKSKCEACGSDRIYTVYTLPRIPAFQNKLFATSEKARATRTAKVDLVACPVCDLVFNALFDDSVMDYDDDYQNAQDHSPSFKAYLDEIANLVMKGMEPADKVVEIGCGKGFFLNVLRSRGVSITGYDPAYEGNDPSIVKAYFDVAAVKGPEVDVVVMRHTLEHIGSPQAFLFSLKKILQPDTRIFIEVPRFEWIVEHKAFWDIFHEHCNYFSERFFHGIFAGKIEITKTFDAQYMLVSALIGDLVKKPTPQSCPAYSDIFQGEIKRYDASLAGFKRNYVWGAGAKGIAFVNVLDPATKRIEALIDINPKKQGHYAPMTGHPCISPMAIDWAQLGPEDCLWIMNGNYKKEILDSLPQLRCKVIVLGEG